MVLDPMATYQLNSFGFQNLILCSFFMDSVIINLYREKLSDLFLNCIFIECNYEYVINQFPGIFLFNYLEKNPIAILRKF